MDQCSFCGRPKNEVRRLYQRSPEGPAICNKCQDDAGKSGGSAVEGPSETPSSPEAKGFTLKIPREMYAHLNEYVIAQDDCKRSLSVAVYNHYKRLLAKVKGLTFDTPIDKSNILVMGPSGCGKTQAARSLARLLKVPFFVADTTKLTQAGYVGDDVESLLQGLMAECDGNIEQAEWGIVFLDEIDKLARKSGRGSSGFRDVTGEGVQQALLKLVEGSKVQVPRNNSRTGMGQQSDLLDTSNILFICAGSFAGIEEIVKARINKAAGVGFGKAARQEVSTKEIFSQITEEDLLEFGIIPELLGRIPVRTSVYPLTEEELVRILVEPKDALTKQCQALYSMDEIKLEFEPDALRAIAAEAHKRTTGARALRTIVEAILNPYSFELPGNPNIEGLTITKDVVESNAPARVTLKTPSVSVA